MSTLALIKEQAKEHPIDAAVQLCRGLMAHSPSDPFRQGYTLGNALLAAASLLDLDRTQVAIVAEKLVDPLLTAATEGLQFQLDHALEGFGVAVGTSRPFDPAFAKGDRAAI